MIVPLEAHVLKSILRRVLAMHHAVEAKLVRSVGDVVFTLDSSDFAKNADWVPDLFPFELALHVRPHQVLLLCCECLDVHLGLEHRVHLLSLLFRLHCFLLSLLSFCLPSLHVIVPVDQAFDRVLRELILVLPVRPIDSAAL